MNLLWMQVVWGGGEQGAGSLATELDCSRMFSGPTSGDDVGSCIVRSEGTTSTVSSTNHLFAEE